MPSDVTSLYFVICAIILIIIIYVEYTHRQCMKKRNERRKHIIKKVRDGIIAKNITPDVKAAMISERRNEERNQIGPYSRRDLSYAKGPDRAYI